MKKNPARQILPETSNFLSAGRSLSGGSFNKKTIKKIITRKKAVKIADEAFSLYIRKRDNLKCYCGRNLNQPMQCGHLISRSNFATRWDPLNAACSHSGCNFSHEYHPEIFTNWWIKQFGQGAYDLLIQKSHTVLKISTGELLTLAEYYRRETEKIVEKRNA